MRGCRGEEGGGKMEPDVLIGFLTVRSRAFPTVTSGFISKGCDKSRRIARRVEPQEWRHLLTAD